MRYFKTFLALVAMISILALCGCNPKNTDGDPDYSVDADSNVAGSSDNTPSAWDIASDDKSEAAIVPDNDSPVTVIDKEKAPVSDIAINDKLIGAKVEDNNAIDTEITSIENTDGGLVVKVKVTNKSGYDITVSNQGVVYINNSPMQADYSLDVAKDKSADYTLEVSTSQLTIGKVSEVTSIGLKLSVRAENGFVNLGDYSVNAGKVAEKNNNFEAKNIYENKYVTVAVTGVYPNAESDTALDIAYTVTSKSSYFIIVSVDACYINSFNLTNSRLVLNTVSNDSAATVQTVDFSGGDTIKSIDDIKELSIKLSVVVDCADYVSDETIIRLV